MDCGLFLSFAVHGSRASWQHCCDYNGKHNAIRDSRDWGLDFFSAWCIMLDGNCSHTHPRLLTLLWYILFLQITVMNTAGMPSTTGSWRALAYPITFCHGCHCLPLSLADSFICNYYRGSTCPWPFVGMVCSISHPPACLLISFVLCQEYVRLPGVGEQGGEIHTWLKLMWTDRNVCFHPRARAGLLSFQFAAKRPPRQVVFQHEIHVLVPAPPPKNPFHLFKAFMNHLSIKSNWIFKATHRLRK